MMCGWEKIGEWVGPDYFPPFGGNKFESMCRSLREKGIQVFPFGLSGLKLPIRKKIPRDASQPELSIDYDNREIFEKQYRPFAAAGSSGDPIIDSFPANWDGLHGYACVTSSQAREQLYGASLRLAVEYGANVSQADQVFGGAVPECYHPDHGHTPGRGTWQVEALREIYADTRRDAKKGDPDFALSQEFPCELYIQYLDVCHGRVSDQPRGIWGVPLFSYLYHEYLPCYGGDWSSLLRDNSCGVYVQANNFVFGSLPAGSPQTAYKKPVNELPQGCDERILLMARHACALSAAFPQYIILGKMLRPDPLDVPDIQIPFVGMDFAGWKKKTLPVPAVLHCLWQGPDRSRAYALANISDSPRRLTLPCASDIKEAVLWINGKETPHRLKPAGGFDFTMAPLDAAVLELKTKP
jgi:hypothetical protein